jgi:hypothetical protein
MVTINQLFNGLINVQLDPAQLAGDPMVVSKSAYLTAFVAGKAISVDTNGYAVLASDTAPFLGILQENGSPDNIFENTPAIGSGYVSVIAGGVLDTDQVVETSLAVKDVLYANNGLLTKTAPSGSAKKVAVVLKGNSASDKTTKIMFLPAY